MSESKSNEIIVIGKMDHTLDNTLESANRVYSKDGIWPTIPTCAGGNIQPKIIDDTEEKHRSVIIDDIYKNRETRVYKETAPTLRSKELKTIVAMRGRNPENPSDRTVGAKTEQRLEPECINLYDEQGKETSFQDRVYKTDKISPAITTSFRPNYAVEHNDTDSEKIKIKQATNLGVCKVESRYRIRKLTPKECWRLMGFSDEDFEKAAKVNSNTQLYKQAGNSIVKDVLMTIFRQMID